MKISTSISPVIRMYGLEDSLQILADAGFEAIDYYMGQGVVDWDADFFQNAAEPAFAAHFKGIAKAVRDHGLEMYQCHASWAPVYVSDLRLYTHIQKHIIQAIYAAGYMECPNIVGHPVMHVGFTNGQNRELARQITLDHFAAMAPALQETGVTMCIENLYFSVARQEPRASVFGSDAEDLCDIIDTLNDMYGPHFAACLDTGHATLLRRDPAEMIKTLGNRLRVLHINDNHNRTDEHLIPTRGVLDWKKIAEALGEIDYTGTFNFEIASYFEDFPRDIYSRDTFQRACNLLYGIGRSLADIAEGKR